MTESEFEKDRRDRISRIMKMHEKPHYVKQSPKPVKWTKDDIKNFRKWGMNPQILKAEETTQNKLF